MGGVIYCKVQTEKQWYTARWRVPLRTSSHLQHLQQSVSISFQSYPVRGTPHYHLLTGWYRGGADSIASDENQAKSYAMQLDASMSKVTNEPTWKFVGNLITSTCVEKLCKLVCQTTDLDVQCFVPVGSDRAVMVIVGEGGGLRREVVTEELGKRVRCGCAGPGPRDDRIIATPLTRRDQSLVLRSTEHHCRPRVAGSPTLFAMFLPGYLVSEGRGLQRYRRCYLLSARRLVYLTSPTHQPLFVSTSLNRFLLG